MKDKKKEVKKVKEVVLKRSGICQEPSAHEDES